MGELWHWDITGKVVGEMRILKILVGTLFLLVGIVTFFGLALVVLNVLLVVCLITLDSREAKPAPLRRYWVSLGALDLAFFLVVATFGWPGKPLSFVIMITTGWTLAFWLTAGIGATLLYDGFGLRGRAKAAVLGEE
jgi:hypothetical protein